MPEAAEPVATQTSTEPAVQNPPAQTGEPDGAGKKSLLGEQEPSQKPAETGDASNGGDVKPPATETQVPEKYEIKAGEGAELDAVAVEAVSSLAKELGLQSNEQAQKLYDTFQQERAETLKALQEAQVEANNKQQDQWQEELKALPDHKEKLVLAKRAVETMPEEVRKAVEDGPWGDWPPLVNWLADVAQRTGEHKVHVGGAGGAKAAPWDIMYPDMAKK